ncbi:TetR/AcrR family transcriptional regulator [Mycobacterium sp. NPDC048908]|uniref:TetR/AcrR family transcriptional regulator n=1 Tax=Mycobacterium sp. NPDC048908 TaxID=3364292 RepID=UPI00371FC304
MAAAVKREYRSNLRAAHAVETRRRIVASAAELFVAHGYGATTVDAVAEAAGVSRKTVFTAVGSKLDLLITAVDWAVAGDDEPVPVADRTEMREALQQRDPGVLLTRLAHSITSIGARVAPLYGAVEVAAGLEPGARAVVENAHRGRLDDARKVVDRLRDLDALTGDLTYEEAVDLVWLATDPTLFDRLVHRRGWTVARFEEWLAEDLCRQLLGG